MIKFIVTDLTDPNELLNSNIGKHTFDSYEDACTHATSLANAGGRTFQVAAVRTNVKFLCEIKPEELVDIEQHTMVDPPDGWKYGFPARLEADYVQQLINAGYPANQIDLAIKHSRYWIESSE